MNCRPGISFLDHAATRSRTRAPFILICATVISSAAAEPPQAARPAVVVKTIRADAADVTVSAGRLISFSLTEGLTIEDTDEPHAAPLHVAASDVVHIATHSLSAAPSVGMTTITLTNGDRIIGTPGEFSAMAVALESTSVGALVVPLDDIAYWQNPQAADLHMSWQRARSADFGVAVDRVWLVNGDFVEGVVQAIDRQAFTLETDDGLSRIAQERVAAAVIVAPPPPPDKRLRARVTFVDGTQLTTHALQWRQGQARMALPGRADSGIPVRHISRVDVIGGRWRWLSELGPVKSAPVSAGQLGWSHRLNRNVLGGPLSVAGQRFERGIGVHSPSEMTFPLDGDYRALVLSFGIDDDSGPFADVTVRVKVDGRLRYEQESVRPGRLFGPVRIDVTDGHRLELLVDYGKMGAIQDRLDWIVPALIR